LALLLALAGIAVICFMITQLSSAAIAWLHHQPRYQLSFLDIELKPPPPGWFRGGRAGFLKQVRENARESEMLELMELQKGSLDRDQIALDFKKDPWVEDVPRVDYPPHSITVHLAYRTPVAWIQAPPAPPVYLDRRGFVVPMDDVDKEKLGPLLRVIGKGLEQASEGNQPGLQWRPSATSSDGARLRACVEEACTLAGFLVEPERASESSSTPALRVMRIIAADHRGLWLVTSEDAIILWGEPPGKERNGSLMALEKWEIFGRWAKVPERRTLPPGDYWEFSKSGLVATQTNHNRK
jgi:hypothetical protein